MSTVERKAYQRAYYLEHRDKLRARATARYREKTPQIRAQAKQRYETDHVSVVLDRARQRARKLGVPFDLGREDIVIPERCPILGMKLARARGVARPPTVQVLTVSSQAGVMSKATFRF